MRRASRPPTTGHRRPAPRRAEARPALVTEPTSVPTADGAPHGAEPVEGLILPADFYRRDPREVAPEKPREDTPGKKVQAGRAAHEAATTLSDAWSWRNCSIPPIQ